jgi:hypothetical protein
LWLSWKSLRRWEVWGLRKKVPWLVALLGMARGFGQAYLSG